MKRLKKEADHLAIKQRETQDPKMSLKTSPVKLTSIALQTMTTAYINPDQTHVALIPKPKLSNQ